MSGSVEGVRRHGPPQSTSSATVAAIAAGLWSLRPVIYEVTFIPPTTQTETIWRKSKVRRKHGIQSYSARAPKKLLSLTRTMRAGYQSRRRAICHPQAARRAFGIDNGRSDRM